jgi:hypothetical protein
MKKETTMSRNKERLENSSIYNRINHLPLTPAERAVAIHGLREGEMIANAILAVVNGIKRLISATALKPSLGH